MVNELLKYIYDRHLENEWVECTTFFLGRYPNELDSVKLKNISDRIQKLKVAGLLDTKANIHVSIGGSVPVYPPLPAGDYREAPLTFDEINTRINSVGYTGAKLEMQLTVKGIEYVEKIIFQKQLKSVNASTIALNTQTGEYYNKQSGFNKWQKYLTGTIMLATVAYTISSVATCNILLRSQTQQDSLKKIKSLVNNRTLSDSILRKNVQGVLETSP